MITQLPVWIEILVTLGTGIFFWAVFYATTITTTKKTQETVEELREEGKKTQEVMFNIDKNVALINQRQEYIQTDIMNLKNRLEKVENKVA